MRTRFEPTARRRRCLAVAIVTATWSGAVACADVTVATVRTIVPGFAVADHLVEDVDGDGRADLVVIGRAGEVRVWRGVAGAAGRGGLAAEPAGALVLADPAHCLFALADLAEPGPARQLVAATPEGVTMYPLDDAGGFADTGTEIVRRSPFDLRTGEPRRAAIAEDVNGDGRMDLVLPSTRRCELWLNEGPETGSGAEGGPPRFRRAARVRVDVEHDAATGAGALSDTLSSNLSVPGLATEDVNGDGRADLVVRERRAWSFHIQQDDGTIPPRPDVELDLDMFRDTTPKGSNRPGRTLIASDKAQILSRDLSGDGIPDYLIAHRRKVWVFHGSDAGPGFTDRKPAQILRAADDMTVMLLDHLDDDGRADLLVIRLQVPSVTSLILGMLGTWSVEIDAAGYRNEGGVFAGTPRWRREVVVRLPPLASVLKNPESFIRRFEEATSGFRPSRGGDFDGDGREDVMLVSSDGAGFELWLGRREPAGDDGPARSLLRGIFFEQERREWDLERIWDWLESLADETASGVTGGRPPDGAGAWRDAGAFTLRRVQVGDLDGDGADEIVAGYERRSDGMTVIDVLRARKLKAES